MLPLSSEDLGSHIPDGDNLVNGSVPFGDQKLNDFSDRIYRPEDSSDDEHPATNEVDFRVFNILTSFANNSVIHKLCWLLRFYKSNPPRVNKNVINILQLISDDLQLSPMLYQLSVLTIFHDILIYQKSSKCNESKSINDFITNLVRKMLKKLKNQPLLFVELLFWKTRKECHYINAESLLDNVHSLQRKIEGPEGIEVGSTSERRMPFQKSIADSLGEDEAELLIPHNVFCQNNGISEENPQTNRTEDKRESPSLTPNFVINRKGKHSFSNQSEGSSSTEYSKRASARKTRFIFDQEQELKIRGLYEKYKDERQCSHIIAAALDPDGKVPPIQVSRKLKQLGLSVTSRKRELPINKSSNAREDQADTTTPSPSGLIALNDTSQHVRKRIRAFSIKQEVMVRNLYEKFKDHERCTHMIAKALDTDNIYNAAQVSRKLKQLGLHVPQKRRPSKGSKHSGDVKFHEQEQSDDETLVMLLGRCNNNNGVLASNPELALTEGGGSDDELLSTMLKSKRKRNFPENVKSKLEVPPPPGGDSKDECLSMIIINKEHSKSSVLPTSGNSTLPLDSNTKEPNEDDMGQRRDMASVDCEGDAPNQTVNEYELADSGDDLSLAASVKIGTRTLKMVIDADDED